MSPKVLIDLTNRSLEELQRVATQTTQSEVALSTDFERFIIYVDENRSRVDRHEIHEITLLLEAVRANSTTVIGAELEWTLSGVHAILIPENSQVWSEVIQGITKAALGPNRLWEIMMYEVTSGGGLRRLDLLG